MFLSGLSHWDSSWKFIPGLMQSWTEKVLFYQAKHRWEQWPEFYFIILLFLEVLVFSNNGTDIISNENVFTWQHLTSFSTDVKRNVWYSLKHSISSSYRFVQSNFFINDAKSTATYILWAYILYHQHKC